jgi:hypothetical protein
MTPCNAFVNPTPIYDMKRRGKHIQALFASEFDFASPSPCALRSALCFARFFNTFSMNASPAL